MTPVASVSENRAFRSFWKDGLLDLMFGLVILVVGLSWWQEVAVLGAVFPSVCAGLWYPLRKRLVEPRLGYVEFSGDRDLNIRSFRHGLTAFLTGSLTLAIILYLVWTGNGAHRPMEWIAGLPLALLAIPALFFSVFTRCVRYAFYALLLLIAGGIIIMQGWEPHVGLMASGLVISIAGLVILARFLLHYPALNAT